MDINLSNPLKTEELLNFSPQYNILDEFDKLDIDKIASQLISLYDYDKEHCDEFHETMERYNGIVKNKKEYRRAAKIMNGSQLNYTLFGDAVTEFCVTFNDEFPFEEPVKTEIDFDLPTIDELSAQTQGQVPIEELQQQLMQIQMGFKVAQSQAKDAAKLLNYQLTKDMPCWGTDTENLPYLLSVHGCALRKRTFCPIEKKPVHKLVKGTKVVVDKDAKNIESASRISECETYTYDELLPLIKTEYFHELFSDNDDSDDYDSDSDDKCDKTYDIIEMSIRLDLDDDGYPEPYVAYLEKSNNKLLRLETAFDTNDVLIGSDDEIILIKSNPRYVLYTFLPDDESFFGRGLCHLLEEYQDALSSILNLTLDTSVRASMGGGVFAADLKIPNGQLNFRPGEWKPIQNMGGQIKDSFMPLPFGEPSSVLLALMQAIDGKASSLANLSQFNAENFTSNLAPTTAMIYANKATEKLRSILRRIFRTMNREIEMLVETNGQYVNLQRYQFLADIVASPDIFLQKKIKYVVNKDIDSIGNMATMARVQYLDGKSQDPLFNQKLIRQESLEAMGFKDPDRYLVEPQPPAQPQVDPLIQAQAQALLEQVKLQQEQLALNAQKQQFDFDKKQQELELARERQAQEFQEKFEKLKLETAKVSIEREKLLLEQEINEQKIALEKLKAGAALAETQQKLAKEYNEMQPDVTEITIIGGNDGVL